jgi:quinol monooxygenase YgiN
MAVIVVATAFPVPEHREEVIAAFEAAIGKVHAEEDGCELYALHEGPDGRLVMIEKYASDEAVAAPGGHRARRAEGRPEREAVRSYRRAGSRAASGWRPRQGRVVAGARHHG